MSEPSNKQRSMAGTIAAAMISLLLLFALYVLSAGPLEYLHMNGWLPGSDDSWRAFYLPVRWLFENTPLQQPLHAYGQWWTKR